MSHSHDHNHDHSMHSHVSTTPMAPQGHTYKDFIPLIAIFLVIIVFNTIMHIVYSGDVLFAMRNFMAGFFIVFGAFKIINWKGFVEAYQMYDIIAKRSKIYAYLYPLIELGLGVAYLTAINLVVTNWVTLAVMVISSIGVAQQLLKKQLIQCACLGVVFKVPMTKVTLVEDVLMAVMAAGMLFVL
jgi:hypothetical protein